MIPWETHGRPNRQYYTSYHWYNTVVSCVSRRLAMGLPWANNMFLGGLMRDPWETHSLPMGDRYKPMGDRLTIHARRIDPCTGTINLLESHEFPMGWPWTSYGRSMGQRYIPMGAPARPMGDPTQARLPVDQYHEPIGFPCEIQRRPRIIGHS